MRSSNVRFDKDRLITNPTVDKMKKDIDYSIINENGGDTSEDEDISSDDREVRYEVEFEPAVLPKPAL